MLESLPKLPANFEAILMYVVAFNIAIVGVQTALDKIKDVTKSDLDNKVSAILHYGTDILSKILDFLSANKKH